MESQEKKRWTQCLEGKGRQRRDVDEAQRKEEDEKKKRAASMLRSQRIGTVAAVREAQTDVRDP